MASFLKANLPSDEKDDEEYIPSPKDIETEQELTKDAEDKSSRASTVRTSLETKAKVEELWKQLKQGALSKGKNRRSESVQWNQTEFLTKRKNDTVKGKADQYRLSTQEQKDVGTKGVRKKSVFPHSDQSVQQQETTGLPAQSKKRPPTGVDALLERFSKKKKTSVLDKSKTDWRGFKETHKKDAEELNAHQKSSEKYLEKTEFLERAAQKEYEINREKRCQRP